MAYRPGAAPWPGAPRPDPRASNAGEAERAGLRPGPRELVTNAYRYGGGAPLTLRFIRDRSLICE
ncbi:hypothetical protein, partial [Streptomyces sp. NPDC023588]|uniref:hypothetical protein n=1 Tax=Streptomyces sp. NPDC023588 TaxID=3154907 RepID=UPI003404FAC6